VFELIKQDIDRYYQLERDDPNQQLSLLTRIRILLISHGLHVVASYRLASFIDQYWRKGILWKCLLTPLKAVSVCWELVSIFLYGSQVTREAVIGGGFYIGHIGGIVIGPARIGDNFTITHNLTIGRGKAGNERGIPYIGNNVWIGTNVVLFGKIDIGSGVAVMPGTIISKNIADKVLAGGNPVRILQREHDNSSLLFGLDAVRDAAGAQEE
jgi:serine O-acetyltransferase